MPWDGVGSRADRGHGEQHPAGPPSACPGLRAGRMAALTPEGHPHSLPSQGFYLWG